MSDSSALRGPRGSGRGGLALLAASAALAGGTAAILISRHRLWAGAPAAASALALLLVGSASPGRDRRTRFAYQVMDLAFDTCILAPLAWVARLSSMRVAVLSLVGLGASYVASYERARGRSLGYEVSEGPAYRVLRAGLLVLGLLTGWVEGTLWAFAVLTVAAAAFRAWSVAEQHRESVEAGRAG